MYFQIQSALRSKKILDGLNFSISFILMPFWSCLRGALCRGEEWKYMLGPEVILLLIQHHPQHHFKSTHNMEKVILSCRTESGYCCVVYRSQKFASWLTLLSQPDLHSAQENVWVFKWINKCMKRIDWLSHITLHYNILSRCTCQGLAFSQIEYSKLVTENSPAQFSEQLHHFVGKIKVKY